MPTICEGPKKGCKKGSVLLLGTGGNGYINHQHQDCTPAEAELEIEAYIDLICNLQKDYEEVVHLRVPDGEAFDLSKDWTRRYNRCLEYLATAGAGMFDNTPMWNKLRNMTEKKVAPQFTGIIPCALYRAVERAPAGR